jgi:hypothetical protein
MPGPTVQSEEIPKIYGADSQFLGIFPSTWDGYLSFFVPTLSKFVALSPYTGDVVSYSSVQVYYDAPGCMGNAYIDAGMRYQVMKLESKYIMADDVGVGCINYRSFSELRYGDMGPYRQCNSLSGGSKCNLLPSREVTLPFTTPVVQPVQYR